jgi:putative Mg2+ transporter-C (MgtC) family protein
MFDWHEASETLLHLSIAFALTGIIGWNREQEQHNLGIRAFPIVGVASCGYLLLMHRAPFTTGDLSRVLQGMITGIGFVGGGAIVKEGATAHGTATAASVWCAGAIGAAVALDHFPTAIVLTLLTMVALRVLLPIKTKLDGQRQRSTD